MPEIDRKPALNGSKLNTSVCQTTDSAGVQVGQADDNTDSAVRTGHQKSAADASLAKIQQDSEQIEQSIHTTRDKIREVGGRDGPDPVRYGDWEKGGRCIDF